MIENLLSGLEASQKIFLDNNAGEEDEIVELLSEIKQERHFEKIGVVNLAGISLDDTGRIEKIEDTEFLNSMRNNQNLLSEIKQERHFEKIGVVNLAGISLDDTGRIEKIEDTEFLNSMRNNQNYISNVIDISDIMIIAVPITRNDEVTGAI